MKGHFSLLQPLFKVQTENVDKEVVTITSFKAGLFKAVVPNLRISSPNTTSLLPFCSA